MTADEGWTHRFGAAIAAVVAVTVLLGTLTILFALGQPWLPGHFDAPDQDHIEYIAPSGDHWSNLTLSTAACPVPILALKSSDVGVVRQPDAARQARLAGVRCFVTAPGATLAGVDALGLRHTVAFTQRPRRFIDLDLRFWSSWMVGVIGMLITGAVWSLRPREAATQLFAINGFALMASCMAIAACTVIQPGSDPYIFWKLVVVNETANQLFYLSLLALFLQYPRRLVPGAWAWSALALAVPLGLLEAVKVLPYWLDDTVLAITELVGVIAMIVWQGFATRGHPRDRAALLWLGLAVIIGSALWICILAASLITRRSGAASSIAVLIIVFPFYVGLAMGVARFCLVELQDWTFRILFFVAAAVMFAACDVSLVTALHIGQAPAATVSVLVIAFAWLPLRDVIWRRLFRGRSMSRSDMFAAVMDVTFAVTPSQRAARWHRLLQDLFEPLRLEPAATSPTVPLIAEGGLRLDVPEAAGEPALSLYMARQGRGLFSPSQLALVGQLVRLVRTASSSRDAYERGAAEERRRLAQDLHDDVGARLMTGLGVADDRTRPILQGALADIRAIAAGMVGTTAPLDRVLADIRHECVRRFEAAGLETEWLPWPDGTSVVLIDYGRQKALASGLRETSSNIIRHAGATRVAVTFALDGDRLMARIIDDGCGLDEAALSGEAAGQGLKGLQSRLAEAGGVARFGNNQPSPGAWVELTLPLGSGDAS